MTKQDILEEITTVGCDLSNNQQYIEENELTKLELIDTLMKNMKSLSELVTKVTFDYKEL